MEDVRRDDRIGTVAGVAQVDELQRGRVAHPDDDGNLGVRVDRRPAGVVGLPVLEQRRGGEVADGERAADAFRVADSELPAYAVTASARELSGEGSHQPRIDTVEGHV